MYAQRIQIKNYGPIGQLDISFPVEGDSPKPIVLVGENGSGKSILLSHVVNGLLSAHGLIYPDTPEVEAGKVYKIRSPFYISSGSEYCYGRVDFEGNLYWEELILNRFKRDFPVDLITNEAKKLWQKLPDSEHSNIDFNFNTSAKKQLLNEAFNNNCVLYFPPNRFEEPAWLNEENLKAKAEYMNLKQLQGYADRKIINYSPLRDNQNWLFEVLFDRCAFEVQTTQVPLDTTDNNQQPQRINVPVFRGYGGKASAIYESALCVVRSVFRAGRDLRFGIGKRQDRKISLMQGNQTLVPNIFQFSSGETSLLNLFISILRDFDLSYTNFTDTENVRGTVIVDEIDLHLHVIHQYEILPQLMKMFPRVQFIVTTHSPLFVLGMEKTFGQEGFALYRLPQGQQISPEEFSEFGSAYESLTETRRFLDDIQQAIQDSRKPIVFMDGEIDVTYLRKAAKLLGREATLQGVQLRDGGGFGNLDNIWKKFDRELAKIIPQKVMLLHDCDKSRHGTKGNVLKRNIPRLQYHPLQTGIENLFEKKTLERAREFNSAFIDISGGRTDTLGGEEVPIPETWTVNEHKKKNLCDWLCEEGTKEDYQHFEVIFELLKEILPDHQEPTAEVAAD